MGRSNLHRTREAHESNVEAARIILENPERYTGALLDWARTVLGKQAPERQGQQSLQLEGEFLWKEN